MTNKPKSNRAQDARQFTRHVFEFLGRVARDDKLPASASAIAIVLSHYFNRKYGGTAWPSCRTIATEIGVDKATVLRTLRRMEARGHLRIEWGTQGRGHGSQFWMADAAAPSAEKVRPRTFKTTRKGALKGAPTSRKGAPTHQILPKNHPMASANAEASRGESQALTRLDPGARCFEGSAPEENKTAPASPPTPDRFRELRVLWQRPWPDCEADARRAFAEACREVDPHEIVEAAKVWVAAADAPRFLPALKKWLTGRGWEKPPPMRRQRRAVTERMTLGDHLRVEGQAPREPTGSVLRW